MKRALLFLFTISTYVVSLVYLSSCTKGDEGNVITTGSGNASVNICGTTWQTTNIPEEGTISLHFSDDASSVTIIADSYPEDTETYSVKYNFPNIALCDGSINFTGFINSNGTEIYIIRWPIFYKR